jgi:hypothetical protein
MSSYAENYHVVVMGAYSQERDSTTTTFVWPEENSGIAYNVEVNPHLSLEFDGLFAVRLTSITAHAAGLSESLDTITKLTTPELSERFSVAQKVGQFVLDMHVTLENRLFIAGIQLASPLTPQSLKDVCREFIEANERLQQRSTDEIA